MHGFYFGAYYHENTLKGVRKMNKRNCFTRIMALVLILTMLLPNFGSVLATNGASQAETMSEERPTKALQTSFSKGTASKSVPTLIYDPDKTAATNAAVSNFDPSAQMGYEDYLFFNFMNDEASVARYNSATYSCNFDEVGTSSIATRWYSGGTPKTTNTINNASGFMLMVAKAYGTNGFYAQTALSPVAGHQSDHVLNYTSQADDVFRIRFQIRNAVAVDGATPTISFYCMRDDETSVERCTDKIDLTGKLNSGNSGSYITLEIPTNTKYKGVIKAIRVQIEGVTSASESALARIYIASMYLGPDNTDDMLYFDFNNDADAISRYQSAAYNGYNYDTATNPLWATRESASSTTTTDGNADAVIDNTAGTLSVNVATTKFSTNYGPWVATTKKHGTYTYGGNQSQPLSYDPANADYIQLRFKVTGCTVTTGKTPTVTVVYDYTDPTTLNVTRCDYSMTATYTATDEEYQTLTIALEDVFKNAVEINNIGFRFYHLISGGDGKVVIDYIYVGPEETLPTKAMFFDFTNDSAAKERYASTTYGGNNYDANPDIWTRTPANNSISVTNTGLGTLNLDLEDPATGGTPFAQTSTGATVYGTNPLDYRPNENDVVQIRFRAENVTLVAGTTAMQFNLYYKADGEFLTTETGGAFVKQLVELEWLYSGQYYTVNLELPDNFTQANVINAIRPQFVNLREISGADGRVFIDYIYIGPQEHAPISFMAQRKVEAVDYTGENYRLTYSVDMFRATGSVRFREMLAPEFEWYDPSDETFGKDAIKVYKAAYAGNGNYSSTKTQITTGYEYLAFTDTIGETKTINLRLTDMVGAYRRDNDIAGYRYIVEINFRVDHDYTIGGNKIQPFTNRAIAYEVTKSSEPIDGITFSGETLNTAFPDPTSYDFFMELYNEDVDAADKTDMTEKGKAYDLLEAWNDTKANRNYIILSNMFDNYVTMGLDTTYAGVKYVMQHAIYDGYGVETSSKTYYAVTYPAGSTTASAEDKYASTSFDLQTDAFFRTRIIFTPSDQTGTDSLGRAAQGRVWTDAYSYYFAPKFAVVDYGRTVSINMQEEGQHIGTKDDPEDENSGVVYDYGFHILSKNGQLDEHLSNIKFNFRKNFMDDNDMFLLEETAYVYYLTRSKKGEKGQTKSTIASFEPQIAEILADTGIEYDMDLDQYYLYDTETKEPKDHRITYTFGKADETPKALEGEYFTTMRKVTIIPANNIYYGMDKFNRSGNKANWASDGTNNGILQEHDYEQGYTSPYGYDKIWYASALTGETNNNAYGRAWKATVSADSNNPYAKFTFKGTGFEIISHTLKTTGILIVEVYSGTTASAIGDNTNLVRRFLVDTYHADGNLYQLPVVLCNDLPYGQYTVRARGYYHEIFDHEYMATLSAESNASATRSAGTALTEAKIRQVLGLSADDLLTYIPSSSADSPAKRSTTTTTVDKKYDVYLNAFRIYNPMDDVITEAEYPMEYFAYQLSNEVNTSADETITTFYNIKNDLLLDRTTWTGNDANGVLYLGDGTTDVEQGDEVGGFDQDEDGTTEYSIRLGMGGTLETQMDYLFFDFTDTPYDQKRYDNAVYGGVNFDDAANWRPDSTLKKPLTIASGALTMELTDDYSGTGWHHIDMGSTSAFNDLKYIPSANDVYKIRLRVDNATTLDTKDEEIRVGFGYYTDAAGAYVYDYEDVKAERYIDKGYFDVVVDLSTNTTYKDAACITRFRPYFHFIGNSDATASITIDYIYIGPDPSGNSVPDKYLMDVNESLLASGCHGARISCDLTTNSYYCECSERHEMTGNQYLNAGHYYITDNNDARISSACHSAGVSYAHTYDTDKKKTTYHYYCECGSDNHHMNNAALRKSGVTCYDDQYAIDGPANELYLKDGSGIAFDVGTSTQVQISLKAVNGKSVSLYAYDGTTMVDTGISSAILPEMYFRLDSKYIHDGSVFLMCKSDDSTAMMSLCNIKVFNGEKPKVKASLAVKALQIFTQEQQEPTYALDENLSVSMSITAGAEMKVNYMLVASKVAEYEDFYLEVIKETANGESIKTVYEADALEAKINTQTNEIAAYLATYEGINAKEMGDSFSATLYAVASDGTIYHGNAVTDSIKSYLVRKLDNEASSAELKTLAVDMLRYGAAAQVRLGYNTENLVTADLTEEQLSNATQEIPEAADYEAANGEGASLNASITVASRVQLNLSCIYTPSDASILKCVITDVQTGEMLAQLPVSVKEDLMCTALYENVGAKEMRKVINATIYEGETAVSETLSWSVESYVAQTRAKANVADDELNMVNAMLIYGDAVAAYMMSIGQ